MTTQRKLEIHEHTLTMPGRLQAAAKRISESNGGTGKVEGSAHTLHPEQINVFMDFADFVNEVAENQEAYTKDLPTGRIILPPRTGKTVIAGQIISAAGMMTTIIVPTQTLVEQTAGDLRDQLPGISVGVYYGNTKSLAMWGVNVTTYQILQEHHSAGRNIPLEIALSSLVFADEGHHAMTAERQKFIREVFDPLTVRVALTATPNYDKQRRLASYFKRLIHEITISEAVELEMVAPLRVYMAEVDVDASSVKLIGGDYDQEKLGEILSAAPFFEAVRIYRYDEENASKGALICCASRQQGYDLYKYLRDRRPLGTPEPQLMLGEMPQTKRGPILDKFEEGVFDTIINVGVLIEGWNSPRCKRLFDLSLSHSLVRATQKFFRPMTKDGDEEAAIYMFIPKGLPELPVVPMDMFEWNMPEFEQGVLIASKRRLEEEKKTPRLKRTAHTPIEKVSLKSRIVFEGVFEKPALNPDNERQIRSVLESHKLVTRAKIPHYADFKSLVFHHRLFKGRGANLLRYCKVQLSRHDYVLFMARFFPEGASALYADRNYSGVQIDVDERTCAEDLDYMLVELEKGTTRGTVHQGFECGWLALGAHLHGESPTTEDIFEQEILFRQNLRKALGTLEPREEAVIRMYFGIERTEMTLEEIGSTFFRGPERIRQIVAKSLRKLRHPSRANLLKESYRPEE